jgi:hypothetical protein
MRDRIVARRGTLISQRSVLQREIDALARQHPRAEPLRAWRDLLRECQGMLEARLAHLEDAGQGNTREASWVRESLRMLRDGPDASGGPEVIPTVLGDVFAAHGERGFQGRGGVVQAEARLAAIEKERVAARLELEHRITAIEGELAAQEVFA